MVRKVEGSDAKRLKVPEGSYVMCLGENTQILKGSELSHSYRKDNALGVIPAEELVRDYGFLPGGYTGRQGLLQLKDFRTNVVLIRRATIIQC